MTIIKAPATKPSHLFTMPTPSDIATSEDIKTLVDAFYQKVNRDDLLSPIFTAIVGGRWDEHLPVMYKFWDSMLLGAGSYQGAPFPKHAALPLEQQHFERWLTLFSETLDENFSGPKSTEAKSRALCIADTFARRMGILSDPTALARTVLDARAASIILRPGAPAGPAPNDPDRAR